MIRLFQLLSRTLLWTVIECIASLESHCPWNFRKVSDSAESVSITFSKVLMT